MNGIISDNAQVFWAIVRRNMKVFRSALKGSFIDSCAILLLDVIMFGYLFPTMGMSKELIAPVFLGSMVFILFNSSFSFAYKIIFDLEFNHQIDYFSTLPLSKKWYFATYVVTFMVQSFTITMPLIVMGSFLLRNQFADIHPNISLFVFCYFLCLLFLALLFIMSSFCFSFAYFRTNSWPRVFSPLLCLSTDLFPWQNLYDFWPTIANLFLLNPLTHVLEMLRITFVGGAQGLSLWLCIPVVLVSIALEMCLLVFAIKKRLDPV